jgi:membrane associated rhomboid family serine protease
LIEQRERAINAPWPVVTLIAVLLGAYLVQGLAGVEPAMLRYGFSPVSLTQGRWAPLVMALFLHASWAHVLANCAFALAFGSPTARRMGVDARGATAFFLFYLICGVLANLVYAVLHPGDINVVIGASGAVAGLMGAASRLMGGGPDLAPLLSRPVVGMAAAWVLINVIFGAVFAGWAPGANGAPIAWDVHLAGYAFGLFLFSPTLRILGRRNPDHGIEN